jgi:hypothetical protein
MIEMAAAGVLLARIEARVRRPRPWRGGVVDGAVSAVITESARSAWACRLPLPGAEHHGAERFHRYGQRPHRRARRRYR